MLSRIIQEQSTPYFIGRLSGNEPLLCLNVMRKERIRQELINEMRNTAGIHFTHNENVHEYVKEYVNSCKNTTVLCYWGDKPVGMAGQGYHILQLMKRVNPKRQYYQARVLEPFYTMKEESYIPPFQNQHILIIHSHKYTIEKQLDHLDTLFPKPIFKNCTFHIVRPPRQNAGHCDGRPWNEHFNEWKVELDELFKHHSFDTVLVSAGGFGMITSNYIYTKHKQNVIYVGGALQLYFGIYGSRWMKHPIISTFFNEHWTRVLDQDKPPNAKLCENSSYW